MLADRLLFIDGEALVLDKPAGLPVTAVRDETLSLVNHLDSLRFGFARQPVAAHRLDRDTSGCLLLARNPKALRRFGAAFEAGTVGKSYLAVLDGEPEAESGVVDLALAKVSSRAAGWRIVADPRGRPARTRWRKIAVLHGRAMVRFEPETGRTHQIRVHAASGLGLPILGDPVYGGAGAGLMLHARSLRLARTGKPPVDATAPLPERFAALGFAEAMLTDDHAA